MERTPSPPSPRYLPYDDSVERTQPDEDELISKIVASMARVNRRTFDQYRHATRDAHAKSHGILRGELTVYDGLPEHLRQGVFRAPRSYPVMARLSSAPGHIQSDTIPVPFGMAIKLLGVEGKKILPGHEDEVTQDFLLVNNPTIPFGDVATYWKTQRLLEAQGDPPELVQRAAASVASGVNAALKLAGHGNPFLEAIGAPRRNILGETFHSMAALRYGSYFGKISAAPLSATVKALSGQPLDPKAGDSLVRDLVVDFFRANAAEYELRVQLCTDLTRMPVEDASVAWPEDESPHQPVAKLSFPAQEAYSPARRVFADDVLSFNPWHCLPDHRPLGSIMRVRIKAYETSSKFRHEMNVQRRVEPRDISELPT
jgi:hypothetical protein